MKSILFVAFSLFAVQAFAQETSSDNKVINQSFFGELGGPGVLFSVNYDRRFTKSKFGIGGRAGLGFISGYTDNYVNGPNGGYYTNGTYRSVVTVPVQINYLFGKENSVNALEIGAGATYLGRRTDFLDFTDNGKSPRVLGTASFMYRRMPTDGGFSWRVGFTPLIANGYIQPFAAASVGYNF